MLSVTEMLARIPSAKMDERQETINIPIQEYENIRNMATLQDKQSIIRDLQRLLLNKEEDLTRYREKCELTESVLHRTQKALDKCLQSEQSQVSIPLRPAASRQHRGIIQLKRSDSKPKSTSNSGGVEVVSRAMGDESSKQESSPSASLPDPSTRTNLVDDSTSIKSLPLSLSIGSPGMSTALLKRLVQENLKLKSQLDRKNLPKSSKITDDPERTISELKMKLERQQSFMDLLNLTSGEGRQDAISAKLAAMYKENEKSNTTIEMDRIVISSLRQENMKFGKEKEEMEALLVQYRQIKSVTEETEEKMAELNRKLKAETESRIGAESKIDSLKTELDSMKHILEKAEQDGALAVQNYNTLCAQFHRSSDRPSTTQPAYKIQTPPPSTVQPAPRSVDQPASLPPYQPGRGPLYGDAPHIQSRGGVTRPQQPKSPLRTRGLPQPQQESSTQRMTQSTYTSPTYQSSPPPLPTERKTYRCPRCDTVFSVLQNYRDHIKICLKS